MAQWIGEGYAILSKKNPKCIFCESHSPSPSLKGVSFLGKFPFFCAPGPPRRAARFPSCRTEIGARLLAQPPVFVPHVWEQY